MKTISRKQLLGYTIFAVTAGIVLAIVRIYVSLDSLEPGIELYKQGEVADNILHGAVICIALLLFSCMLLPLKDNPAAEAKGTSPLTVFASTLCGFMMIAYDLIYIYDASKTNWAILGPIIGHPRSTWTVAPASAFFALALMVLTIPAAIYFLKTASSKVKEKPSYAVFATFAIIWFILFALHAYFDSSTALNSPPKVLRILTLLSFIMYASHETRCIFRIALPRWYLSFAYLAVFLGTLNSISDLILYRKGYIHLSDGYLGIAVELAYVLYILSRLLFLAAGKTLISVPMSEDISSSEKIVSDEP